MKIFNTLLGVKIEPEQQDHSSRLVIQGFEIFSYTWDTVGGGYPNLKRLVEIVNLEALGRVSFTKDEAVDARSDLKIKQHHWFCEDTRYIDFIKIKKITDAK